MTREEAIHELQEDKRLYETEVCHAGDGTPDGRLLEALDMAIEALQDRPKGEWIVERAGNGWNDWINVTCNQCGKKFEKFGEHNYCPNCGAYMEFVRCKDCVYFNDNTTECWKCGFKISVRVDGTCDDAWSRHE